MGDDPLLGRLLGGTYAIEARLGAGGMGAVYLARHGRTGRTYAVKVLLPEVAGRPHAFLRFRREAESVSALGHAGIVAVHDFHETDDGIAYIVMDHLEGEDLAARLARDGALPPPDAMRIFGQVGDALTAAHRLGIVHRDLKPANVFLRALPGAPERAVLLDFGLAKMLEDGMQETLTASGMVMGTPAYMSPEQARGAPVDLRTDLYSLAALLFEMLAGAPPFVGPTPTAVLARVLSDPPPRLSTRTALPAPAGLDDVLVRALDKDPARRHASVPELVGAVSAVAAGLTAPRAERADATQRAVQVVPTRVGPAATPPTRAAPAATPPTRVAARPARGLLWGGLGFGALLVAGGLGAGLWVALGETPTESIIREPPPAPSEAAGPPAQVMAPAPVTPVAPLSPEDAPTVSEGTDSAPSESPPAPTRRGRGQASRIARTATGDRLEAPEPAPGPSSGTPGTPPHRPGVSEAAEAIGRGDFAGCIREARAAPVEPGTLQIGFTCALQAPDPAEARRTCDDHVRRYPRHPFSSSCQSILQARGLAGP